MTTVMWLLLYLWVFYLGFVLYAGCQPAIKNAIKTKCWRDWLPLVPVAPVLIVCGLMDVAFNQTVGRLMFWEWTYTLTFSERLDLHYGETGWRGSMARSIGNVLDKILPQHIHA